MGTVTAFQSFLARGSPAELHSRRCSSGPVLFSIIDSDSDPLWEPPEQIQNRTCGSQAEKTTRSVTCVSKQTKKQRNKKKNQAQPIYLPIKYSWSESKQTARAIHQGRGAFKIAFRSIRNCHLFTSNYSKINGIQPGS